MTTEQIKAMILCDLFLSEEFHENMRNPAIGCEYTYEALLEILLSIRGVSCPSSETPGTFPVMNKSTARGRLITLSPFDDKKPLATISITPHKITIETIEHLSVLNKGVLKDEND